MANLLKIKRGTRAQLNAAVTGNTLNQGEPYLITDENRIAIGTGSNSYVAFAKSSEVQALDADLTAIAGLTGTGFLKRTGVDTWALDTNTYLSAESDTLATVTGRGASTTTAVTLSGGVTVNAAGSSNGVIFAGSTSGTTKVVASAAAGSTTITLPATTGTVALQNDTLYIGTTAVTLSRASANQALTGILSVALAGATSGTITLSVPAAAGTNTVTLPASTGTVALQNDTHYIGTTAVTLSRASANQALTGISSVALPGATSGTITLQPTATAGTNTITLPAATGTVALTSDIPTVNSGTLAVSIGTAGATNTTVTWGTSSGFNANSSGATTYDLKVGPALTALAALMTTAGAGFIKRGATADTYTIDTSTYLTANQLITLSGDASGNGTTAITVTLASVGTAGTYTKVTTDAKGRVTSGTTLAATDIPTLTASKISDFDTQVRTSRLDQMAAPTAAVGMNSQKITGLADPTAAQDAATKNYVDTVAQGLDPKQSVIVGTTANLTVTATATTLTNSGTQAAIAIDGVTLSLNDRVLVKDQTTAAQNGIYTVTNVGSVSTNWVLTRAADADTWPELVSAYVFVEQGSTNADNGYLSTVDPGGTLGTTAVTITQFTGAGQITAGNGLTKTGNTIDVVGTTNRISVTANSIDIDANYAGQSTIVTLGTVTTGTWNATAIGVTKGGTGLTAAITGLLKGNGTAYSAAVAGTDYLDPNSTIDGGTF